MPNTCLLCFRRHHVLLTSTWAQGFMFYRYLLGFRRHHILLTSTWSHTMYVSQMSAMLLTPSYVTYIDVKPKVVGITVTRYVADAIIYYLHRHEAIRCMFHRCPLCCRHHHILASKSKVTKEFVYCFIKLNDIFFLHIVNIMYVVLEWICQIWTKFSEAKLRHVSLNGFARLARYLSFWVLLKPNSRFGRKRMF